MHWPTAFKYVPFDPKVRGFPMDYEPDQCSKVSVKECGTRRTVQQSMKSTMNPSCNVHEPELTPFSPQITGVLWKDYAGAWPPPHLDMGVTIHETWAAMVDCYKAGLVRNIGVCNFKVGVMQS
jgi:diketogulonate reductase-like aldo/keto reductase